MTLLCLTGEEENSVAPLYLLEREHKTNLVPTVFEASDPQLFRCQLGVSNSTAAGASHGGTEPQDSSVTPELQLCELVLNNLSQL